MSKAIEELKVELTSLTAVERAELAQFLIHTLDVGQARGTESASELDLARRSEEILSGSVKGKPANRVFDEIRARYS